MKPKPPPAIPIRWNGIDYRSILHAARTLGIKYPTMRYRIMQGYTRDSDVHTRRLRVACSWNGRHYPTVRAAAEANHICAQGMHYRLQQGYTCDGDLKR